MTGKLLSLGERVRAVASLDPSAPAMEFHGEWHNWEESLTAIYRLKGFLSQAGLGEGTSIGVLLRNRPQHVHAMAAVLGNDCCIVTMNARQPQEKTRQELAELKLPVILADPGEWADDALKKTVVDSGALAIELDPEHGMRVLSEFKPQKGPFRENSPSVAVQMLTSGTTGKPKRVIFGARNLKRSVLGAARLIPGSSGPDEEQEPELLLRRGVVVCWAPVLHVSGMWSVVEHMLQGRRLYLLEKFEPFEWARVIKASGARMAMLSPPVIRMILDAKIPKDHLASLKGVTSGTAPLSVTLEREFESTYDIPVLPAYGATEFPGNGAGWTLADHEKFGESKIGSVGRPRPGVRMRIVDEKSGEELPPGKVGLVEIFARTAATPDGQEPRWMRTTDLGVLDDDGFLWIKGRADSAIIRGGFKVLATDVVKVLEQHEKVKEAAVVGIDDPRLGAVPVAAVIPVSEQNPPTVDELEAHARAYLTAYQVPAEFRIVDELPRTPSLKISMPGVRELFSKNGP